MSRSVRLPNTVPITSSTARKPRGRPFEPGNTIGKGRPKGSLNKSTLLVRELLAENAEEITQKVLELAKRGDLSALRMAMDRICPARAGSPLTWQLPVVRRHEDLPNAYSSLFQAMADGEVTPPEAVQIQHVLDGLARSMSLVLDLPAEDLN